MFSVRWHSNNGRFPDAFVGFWLTSSCEVLYSINYDRVANDMKNGRQDLSASCKTVSIGTQVRMPLPEQRWKVRLVMARNGQGKDD